MKRFILLSSIALLIGTTVWADDMNEIFSASSPTATQGQNQDQGTPVGKHRREGGPCMKITKACHQAFPDDRQKIRSCMKDLLAGKSVDGVSVDQTDLNACQDLRTKRKGETASPAENTPNEYAQ